MSQTRVVVVGGGLAGITAALSCVDGGAQVTLIERRPHLGGLTRSFRHGDWTFDNGQHVFLRCCTAYLELLARIGASGEVTIQDGLDLPVVTPGGPTSRIRSQARLPAPLHLAGSLLRYRHLSVPDRLKLGWAVLPLSRLDLDDPALDLPVHPDHAVGQRTGVPQRVSDQLADDDLRLAHGFGRDAPRVEVRHEDPTGLGDCGRRPGNPHGARSLPLSAGTRGHRARPHGLRRHPCLRHFGTLCQ